MEINNVRIEWLGHSGFLIEIKNIGKKLDGVEEGEQEQTTRNHPCFNT